MLLSIHTGDCFSIRGCRLEFCSAPGIFQRVIESLLQGIKGAVVYLDDILISGSTEAEHLKTLDEVLKRQVKLVSE